MAQIDPITGLPTSNNPAPSTSTASPSGVAPTLPANKIGSVPVIVPPAPITVPDSIYTQPSQYMSNYVTSALQAEQEAQKAQQALQAKYADYAGLTQALGGETGARAEQYQTGGVNDAFNQLSDISAQMQSLNIERQMTPEQIQAQSMGRGRTKVATGVLTGAALRENALRTMALGQQATLAQAQYDKAKNIADQAVDIKYAQIRADIETRKLQLDFLKEFVLSPAQEKAKEARLRQYAKEEKEIEQKAEEEKAINNMIVNASAQGAPKELIDRAMKGKTAKETAIALGEYAGDYLKTQLLKEQLKTEKAQQYKIYASVKEGSKSGTSNGFVEVTPKEIQDLNDTQIARNSMVNLIDQAIKSIQTSGTQVLFGAEAGKRGSLKTNLLLAMKNLEKTGALDAGTINVLSETIPTSEFFATEAAQIQALQTLKDTVVGKSEEYINSYKGTTAETDPRTKRIFEKATPAKPTYSSGNAELDAWFTNTSQAVQTVNTTTTNTYGYK